MDKDEELLNEISMITTRDLRYKAERLFIKQGYDELKKRWNEAIMGMVDDAWDTHTRSQLFNIIELLEKIENGQKRKNNA